MTYDGEGLPGRQGDPLEDIAVQLPELRDQLRRVHHREILLAVLVVAVAVLFTAWSHFQDDIRARNHQQNLARIARLETTQQQDLDKITLLQQQAARTQAENTAFREHFCAMAKDQRVYLAQAPAGPPAGRAAASRLIASLGILCPSPPKG